METIQNRECGGCTACCDGWLVGEVNGHKFSPSVPCYYKIKGGCSIYGDRPDHPCKNFTCDWVTDKGYPEWMKPTESGTLSFVRPLPRQDGSVTRYRTVIETKPMSTEVLFFYFRQFLLDQIPLKIQINGNWHLFGPQDWIELVSFG